jgi:peptide/nickel transport system substrate-binding protein
MSSLCIFRFPSEPVDVHDEETGMPSIRFAFRPPARLLAVVLSALCAAQCAHAQSRSRVNIAVTETSDTHNPYGDSNSLMYGVWCHVYGCLIEYDFDKADYKGLLAQSWEVADPKTWIFHLRRDIRWQNGDPLRADDVVHSFNRVLTDPQSKQKQNLSMVASVAAVDDHTVKVTTKEPTAPLLSYLTQFIITNKAVFDRYGARVADEQHPVGAGEYKLERLVAGQMFALTKNTGFPGMQSRRDAPDRIVYQIVREPEVRAVGLFNGEFQIVERLAPDLIPQVVKNPNTKLASVAAAEFMFLGMTPKHPPWNNKLVRQAVCYAIDRDAIIKNILRGQALRLDGVVGPGQYGYDPATKERYPFAPEKSKALLKQAGFANGVDVDLYTSTGRYLFDRTIATAIVPMLQAVGIRATLHTPEVSTYWSDIQRGEVPFYYWGRQSVIDPSPAMSQYFETGGSPRIGISDPDIDRWLALERVTFDPGQRKKILNKAFDAILDAAPACFLWRYRNVYGMSKSINLTQRPDDRISPTDITMPQ